MKRNSIGYRIETGPNVSGKHDSGDKADEATKPVCPLTRPKINACLWIAGLVRPSEQQVKAALDEEERNKVVQSEIDIDTGTVTEVKGDGSRRVIETGSQQLPEPLHSQLIAFNEGLGSVPAQQPQAETDPTPKH